MSLPVVAGQEYSSSSHRTDDYRLLVAICDTLALRTQDGNEKRDPNPALKASESFQVVSVLTTTYIQKVMIHASKISAELCT